MQYKNKKGYSIIELALGIIMIALLLAGVMAMVSKVASEKECGINDVLKERCAGKVVVNRK